jgi:hypothetical protein
MSEELKFGLNDLQISDDLGIALDNDTYQDQANPAPPVAGNYRIKALSLDYSKYRKGDQQGQPILQDGKFPIFVIGMAEIVEGLVDSNGNPTTRKVGLFQDVSTKPFSRSGVPASGLADLTRSYGTENWSGLQAGIDVLRDAFEQQLAFTAQLDWSIYDSAFVTAAFEQLGLDKNVKNADRSEDERKLVNAIYREARVTGMRNFPYNPMTGKFSHVMVRENVTFKHPVTGANITIEGDHRTFEARPTITRYFPNTAYEAGQVRLGPLNVKAPAQVAA